MIADPTGIRATYRWQDHEAACLDPLVEAMASTGLTPVLDAVALADLVTFGTPLGGRSLVRGVTRYGPDEPTGEGPSGGDDVWVDAYLDALRRSIRTTLDGARRPGCTLSGGLDSRTIAAVAVAEGSSPLAVTFGAPGLPDREIAGAVAAHLGLEHRCDELPPDGPLPWLDLVAEHTSGTGNLALMPGLPTHEAVGGRIDVLLSGASGDALYGGPGDDEAGREGWLERLLQPLRADRRRQLVPSAEPLAERLAEARLPRRGGETPAARRLRHLLRWRQATVIADGVRLRAVSTPVATPFLELASRRLALALPDHLRAGRRLQRLALERLDPALAAIPLAGEFPSPGLTHRSAAYARGRFDHLLRNLWLRGTPERGVAFDVQTALRQRPAWHEAAEALCDAPPPGVDPGGLRRLWDRHRRGRDNHGLLLGRLLVARRFVDRWSLAARS